MHNIESTERNISALFLDGITLGMEAEQEEDDSYSDFSCSLSRGSLLSAFCFIEASANVCLESLNLGGQLGDDIDRIPTLSKFDLYLRLRFKNRKLDRGAFPVQGAQELKTIRDTFVHPKGHKILWEVMTDGTQVSESPRTKMLNLPKVASYFCPEDAIVSLQATHRFLNYFFRDVCKFSPSNSFTSSFLRRSSPSIVRAKYPLSREACEAMDTEAQNTNWIYET